MTVTEVANALGLATLKNRKYQIFKTSAIKGEGLDEAMEWLVLSIHFVQLNYDNVNCILTFILQGMLTRYFNLVSV